MSTHYNAFISYKHAALDNKVAALIEKDLERYHIPKKLQKKTGYKKIERIFRDTDELPITSDLSSTIEEALANSEYLIVLCSTNTHLSTWVEREIDIFLRNHTRDQIFTVIADGEPHDVMPKVLQTREVIRTTTEGEMETVIEDVEPLACDYRLSRKEVKATEVPRLVSAMIGCNYNELMDRQRQYKMKRLTAAAAAVMMLSLGFGGYMLYSNQRINENYRQALINQSRYLAKESASLLDDEQRIPALQLALAALPSEEYPDRPVIPEAVSALCDASIAYLPRMSSNILSDWVYNMPDTVDKFVVDPDSTSLAALDFRNNVKVWNKDNHELVYDYASNDFETEVSDIEYIADNKLLVRGSHYLRCINSKTGEELWYVDDLSEDIITSRIVAIDDEYFMIQDLKNVIYKLSTANGQVEKTYELLVDNEKQETAGLTGAVISPSKDRIAFLSKIGEDEKRVIVIWDYVNEEFSVFDMTEIDTFDDDDYLDNLYWVDDEHLCVSCDTYDDLVTNSSYLNMRTYAINHTILYCIDPKEMTLLWKNEFEYSDLVIDDGFVKVPYCHGVAYYEGNVCNIMDIDTGEVLFSHNVNEPFVCMRSSDTYPFGITANGGMTDVNDTQGNDVVQVMYYFADDIQKAVFNRGVYLNQYSSNEIIYYESDVRDDNWQMYEDAPVTSGSHQDYLYDDKILSLVKENGIYLRVYDPNNKKLVNEIEVNKDESQYYNINILGLKGDQAYVSSWIDHNYNVYTVNVITGEVTGNTLISDGSSYSEPLVSYSDGKLAVYYISAGETIYIYDIAQSDVIGEYPFVEEGSKGFSSKNLIRYDAESGYVYMGGTKDYLINLETKEAREVALPDNWDGTDGIVIDSKNQRVITSDEDTVLVRDFDGNTIFVIDGIKVKFFDPCVYNPTGNIEDAYLLIAFTDGKLNRYSYVDGSYVGYNKIYEVTIYSDDKHKASWYVDSANNSLYVTTRNMTDIIDTTEWIKIRSIPYSIGYHAGSDSFVVYSNDEDREMHLGCFKRYTLEELIERGRKMLDGIEMSEDFKATYGIG
ncbi:MTH538 TIR-like domain [Butyrivibrio hungatei DSM 14810]|uniref:MTH538 TIR-like domain n=1 Tax=Butyrivibrio hungatei DSM 14810 TaxID=1121132 RepID=A0A1M7S6K2_9FIRM|nr:toll/interleukin-1 receptor domain-containing protein [Butyrivibrio hungatei]SHN54071.1 MTH538 TIR-like domain [Butyrivibrio hungatei DSM 14810]